MRFISLFSLILHTKKTKQQHETPDDSTRPPGHSGACTVVHRLFRRRHAAPRLHLCRQCPLTAYLCRRTLTDARMVRTTAASERAAPTRQRHHHCLPPRYGRHYLPTLLFHPVSGMAGHQRSQNHQQGFPERVPRPLPQGHCRHHRPSLRCPHEAHCHSPASGSSYRHTDQAEGTNHYALRSTATAARLRQEHRHCIRG